MYERKHSDLISTWNVLETIIMPSISGKLARVACTVIVWKPLRAESEVGTIYSLIVVAESSKVIFAVVLTRFELVEPTTPRMA